MTDKGKFFAKFKFDQSKAGFVGIEREQFILDRTTRSIIPIVHQYLKHIQSLDNAIDQNRFQLVRVRLVKLDNGLKKVMKFLNQSMVSSVYPECILSWLPKAYLSIYILTPPGVIRKSPRICRGKFWLPHVEWPELTFILECPTWKLPSAYTIKLSLILIS